MKSLANDLPDLELERLVDNLRLAPEDFVRTIASFAAAAADESTQAQLKQLDPPGNAELDAMAVQLCDEGRWELAAPIALQLALHMPQQPRFTFIAATCLEQMNHPQLAAALYAQSLLGSPHPGTLLRMGRCLAVAGQFEAAKETASKVIEACRGHDEHRAVQDAAAEMLERLAAHA
jgi:hypothetical protein